MNFRYANLSTCSGVTGLVVIIDVIRAFTTAACAFSRGAEKIVPVSTIEEALEFKRRVPGSMACGEVNGLPPEGFDFGNSPTQVMKLDLRGRALVQRTSAGTQGIVRSVKADVMLAASFVVAAATVRYIEKLAPKNVTFVVTGQTRDGGDEDLACAQYLEACLGGRSPHAHEGRKRLEFTVVAPYLERVRDAPDARIFYDPAQPEFPETDIIYCTDVDRFDFAMLVKREKGLHVIERVYP